MIPHHDDMTALITWQATRRTCVHTGMCRRNFADYIQRIRNAQCVRNILPHKYVIDYTRRCDNKFLRQQKQTPARSRIECAIVSTWQRFFYGKPSVTCASEICNHEHIPHIFRQVCDNGNSCVMASWEQIRSIHERRHTCTLSKRCNTHLPDRCHMYSKDASVVQRRRHMISVWQ